MALIKCKDCDNEVSDSAESCPKCGAPVPKTIGPDQEQCPFCETIVSSTARVCPGCHARKGYTEASGNVYGKGQTIGYGIVLPLVLSFFAFLFGPTFGSIVLLVSIVVAVLCIRRLMKGELWFRSTNIGSSG